MIRIEPGHEDWPTGLRRLPDPPVALWTRGSIGGVGVAIVGSRQCTRYGASFARAAGRAVGGAGWTVVSGLARGIDTAAHLGALDEGARTVAVLGSGIDRWYPASNREVGDRIVACGGGAVSEYGPGVEPAPWRFPARNRIIVGLSVAVVVVEAAARSGALITARLAMEAGIDVFALPGDLDRTTSEGTNRLIADGAHPIVSGAELVEQLERVAGPATRTVAEPVVTGPMFVHEVAAALGVTIGEARRRVSEWELAGLVRMDGGMVVPASG